MHDPAADDAVVVVVVVDGQACVAVLVEGERLGEGAAVWDGEADGDETVVGVGGLAEVVVVVAVAVEGRGIVVVIESSGLGEGCDGVEGC